MSEKTGEIQDSHGKSLPSTIKPNESTSSTVRLRTHHRRSKLKQATSHHKSRAHSSSTSSPSPVSSRRKSSNVQTNVRESKASSPSLLKRTGEKHHRMNGKSKLPLNGPVVATDDATISLGDAEASGVKLRTKRNMSSQLTSTPSMRILCPRLCHIRKWSGLTYGFNLVSKKGETGHYIDNLEEGFPGFYAGLRDGDRVIEVNSVNVVDFHHDQVVKLIRDSPGDGIKLLVVDTATEKYFLSKGFSISSDKVKAQVKFIACPSERPMSALVGNDETTLVNPVNCSPLNETAAVQLNNSSVAAPQSVQSEIVAEMTLDTSKKRNTHPAQLTRRESTLSKSLKRLSVVGSAATTKLAETWSKSHHVPRLCQMTEVPSDGEYGFVLRSYLDSNEQQVIKIVKNSIADRSGLQLKDIIVEINSVNISNENHIQVTNRIKNTGSQLTFLAVTPKDMLWYKKQGKVPKAHEAIVISTKPKQVVNEPREETKDSSSHRSPVIVNSRILYAKKSIDEPMKYREQMTAVTEAPFLLRKPTHRASSSLSVKQPPPSQPQPPLPPSPPPPLPVTRETSSEVKVKKTTFKPVNKKSASDQVDLDDFTTSESEWSVESDYQADGKESKRLNGVNVSNEGNSRTRQSSRKSLIERAI